MSKQIVEAAKENKVSKTKKAFESDVSKSIQNLIEEKKNKLFGEDSDETATKENNE